jgi:uncharacterized NAD-dependent epimerase/dehydratase family protein
MKKAVIFTHNLLAENFAKTAHGILRGTSRFDVLAVVDSVHGGKDAGEVLDGKRLDIPTFKSISDYIENSNGEAEVCIVGVAFPGGVLPEPCRAELISAMRNGLSIISGLHHYLSEDDQFIKIAKQYNVALKDIRKTKPISDLHFWSGKILDVKTPILAILGTDCAVGKRTTARFLMEACQDQNIKTEIIYTGQTGWMQGYKHGFIFDSTPNDFVSGELERVILECVDQSNPDLILLEGQSSLRNPSGPAGSELILSGNVNGVILVHPLGREFFVDLEEFEYKLPEIEKEIMLIEAYDKKVIAVALNEENSNLDILRENQKKLEHILKIPVSIPLSEGVDEIVELIKKKYLLEQ